MNARFGGTCKREGCIHGGRIVIGQPVRYVPGVRGLIWHTDCSDLRLVEKYEHLQNEIQHKRAGDIPTDELEASTADGLFGAEDQAQDARDEQQAPTGDLAASIAAAVGPLIKAASVDPAQVEGIARKVAREEVQKATFPVVVEYRKPGEIHKTSGPVHCMFPKLLSLLQAGQHVMLWGPPGSGKSTACHKAAELLGIGFDHVELSPMSPDYLLFGAGPLPNLQGGDPTYTRPGFVQAYAGDNGPALFLIDEIWNGSPALLTKLNTGLANGSMSWAGGTVARDPGFLFIAADNTAGLGPSPLHPERRQADVATLSRFARLFWPIDETLEMAAACAHHEGAGPWVQWVQKARKVAAPINAKLQALCSPRASIEGARLLAADWKPADIAECLIMSGFDGDTVDRFNNAAGKPGVIL